MAVGVNGQYGVRVPSHVATEYAQGNGNATIPSQRKEEGNAMERIYNIPTVSQATAVSINTVFVDYCISLYSGNSDILMARSE